MDNDRWKSIEDLFERAVEVPRADRERWLEENCAGDEELRSEILAMLDADDAVGGLLDSPAFASPDFEKFADAAEEDPLPDLIGERLGAYEIVREIGRGGMGAVYLARRADSEFEKLVAIKLIKRGMDTDFILKRFRNERQILATLDNPYIARLIDGGTTADGLPYFVMEYVEGEPIHIFCDRKRLTLGERLRLFLKVCAAVHHAHDNLIIHRDLKPGNILVTDNLDLKLLDFGIAKILNPEFAGDSLAHTITGMRLMTPEYASPEQVKGEDLGPPSDVYALGVLLYELLTGRRPYKFPSKAPHDIARVICEEPPLDPAEAYSTPSEDDTESPERLSRFRNSTVEAVAEELGNELSNILLKALRKSPRNRYESAQELSRDIAAYLEGKPVSAPAMDRDHFTLFENSRRIGLSLAVLPFRQLGDRDENSDFLPLALADAVITRLSNLRAIAVRPTSSILGLAEKEMPDPQEAGRELDATYVLDGRIQRSGDRVRVTAQLIQTEDNKTVWAGHFEEQSCDLLMLQDSISAQVSENLIQSLSGEEGGSISSRGTENAQAYEAYLRGRFHWHSYTVDGLAKALVYFYEAIALDPSFARAYSGVADYYNFLSIFGVMPPDESFPAAREAALKAVELNPNLAEAHISLGIIAFGYDWDNEGAERHLKKALSLNPNLADAHLWYAQLLSLKGKHDMAIREMTIAERLNPQSPSVLVTCAFTYRNARRFERSLDKLRQALRIQPHYYIAQQAFSWNVRFIGNHEETIRVCEESVHNTGRLGLPLYALGYSLAIAGRNEEARAVNDELLSLSERQYVPPVYHAFIHTALGEYAEALEWLSHAVDEKDFWAAWAVVDPRFDELKEDPGFVEIMSKTRAIEEEEAIHQSRIPTRILGRVTAETPVATISGDGVSRRIAIVVLGLTLIVVVAAGGFWSGVFTFSPRNSGTTAGNTAAPGRIALAILPFTTDSHIAEESSLGAGLAESVYRKLGVASGLSVRTAMTEEAGDRSVTEIGKELGADFVLRGSLEKENEGFRVSAELVDAGTARTVWSERFDVSRDGFPDLQVRIADQVLSALTVRLSGSERERLSRRTTGNTKAYEFYLAGRFLMRDRSVESLRKAIASFEKAAEEDPLFALAYVGLADSYSLLNLYEIPPPADAYDKAKANAMKALELDDSLADAHASLGYVLFYGEWNRTEAIRHFAKAIELNPSYATAHHWFALALASMGRADQSIEEIERALELDPRSAIVPSAAGLIYYYAGRYEEALKNCRRSLELNPVMVPAYKTMRIVYEATDKPKLAEEAYQKERSFRGNTDPKEPGWAMITAQVKAVSGDTQGALANLRLALGSTAVTSNPRGYAYEIAIAYALLKDEKNAIAWLRKAREVRDHSFNFVLVDPRLASVRKDPGFRSIADGAFR